jgi:hypothetical protein
MRSFVTQGGRRYVISTAATLDKEWETVVFAAGADGEIADHIEYGHHWHDNSIAALVWHAAMVRWFTLRPRALA